jgi:hypothetical protein
MATYKDIHGFKIQNVSSDPPTSVAGDMWYNSTSGDLKVNLGTPAGAWSTGGSLNNIHYPGSAGGGIQTAAIIFAGDNRPAGANNSVETEIYDGSSWTEVNNLNTGRSDSAGCGSTSSALDISGKKSNPSVDLTNVESWNGTNWTEVTDVNASREVAGAAGANNTAAIFFGGEPATAATELWNGSNWTEVNDLPSTNRFVGGVGTSTAAIAAGGITGPGSYSETDIWNGTNWTEVNDLNTGRYGLGVGGTSTSSIAFGGTTPPYTAIAESWNGTNWTEVADLSAVKTYPGQAGASNSSALSAGGFPGNAVEEWTVSGGVSTIDAS